MDDLRPMFIELLQVWKVFWLLGSFSWGEITNQMDAKNDYFKVQIFFHLIYYVFLSIY